MHVFRVPADRGGSDASFVVTRDYDGAAKSAMAYAAEQLSTLKQKFQGFNLLATCESTFDGVDGVIVDYEWQSNAVMLRQRQAYIPTSASMLTLTLTARAVSFESHEASWQKVLGSLHLTNEPARRDLRR